MGRVLIDVTGLYGHTLTGIATYTTNLIRSLQSDDSLQLEGRYKVSKWRYAHQIRQASSLRCKAYTALDLLDRTDVFHGTDYWIPTSTRIKKVVTIHDLSVYHEGLWPKEFAERGKKLMERALMRARPDAVIVVSDFVKQELLDRFPSLQGRVHTVYHGADHMQRAHTLISPRPYIVALGTVEHRKNLIPMARAMELLQEDYPEFRLKIIGGTHGYRGSSIARELSQIKGVELLGYLPKEEIEVLLTEAYALAYTSMYEGFGFPILEGMRKGIPVITSNFGAMQEVAGDGAMCVDSQDREALLEAMKSIISSGSLRRTLIERGFERANAFTWQQCSDQTKSIYRSV